MAEYILTHIADNIENKHNFPTLDAIKAYVKQAIIANQKNVEAGAVKSVSVNDWHVEDGVMTCEIVVLEKNGKESRHIFKAKEKSYIF